MSPDNPSFSPLLADSSDDDHILSETGQNEIEVEVVDTMNSDAAEEDE